MARQGMIKPEFWSDEREAGLHRENGGAGAMNYQCPLGKHQAQVMDVEAVKREGFHRQGILVVHVGDARLNPAEREMIRRVGRKIYGEEADK
jgi:hypothetical protein